MAKELYSGPDKNKAKIVYKMNRIELSRYVRITSGHNGLFYFKSKIDPEINPVCRFCLENDETFFHLLTACPKFRLDRNDIFLDNVISNDMKWAPKKLLSFSFLPGIRDAIEGNTALRWFGLDEEDLDEEDLDVDPDATGIG